MVSSEGSSTWAQMSREQAPKESIEDAFVAFQHLTPDGFMMFRPFRDSSGQIIDLEWTFVNAAAGRIVGRDPTDLLGKRLLEEMPGNKDEGLFDAYVKVLETGETWQSEFFYDHQGITAWFRTTAAKSEDGLALSFANISELRKGEERLQNLIDSVIAFVGVLSPDGLLLEANQPAVASSGLRRSELIGKPFWECYWWNFDVSTQETLKDAIARAASGSPVRYDAEIRVVGDHRMWIDFQMVPRFNDQGDVVEIIPSGVDITERKLAEEHKELLIKELSHRVKNTLAIVQSIVGQTLRTASSNEELREGLGARLRSIAASHDLLVASEHKAASLVSLINNQVGPYAGGNDRLLLEGKDIDLPGDGAHTLGLLLHELATNASKYGALSGEKGTVTVSWNLIEKGYSQVLELTWVENGGPMVELPTRKGFGTKLIEACVTNRKVEHEPVIAYRSEGVIATLAVDL